MIWNRGDTVLEISRVRACCGMKASMDSMRLEPGSNSICHVIFDLSNRTGEQNKQVLIGSNDPKRPYLDLRLTGICGTAIQVTPAAIRFGELTAGVETVQTLVATNLLDEAVSLRSVSSSVKGVKAEIVESADRSWIIRVTAAPLTAQERLSGGIRLDFSSGAVTVPVVGTATPVIKSVPERITVLSGVSESVDRQAVLSSSDGRAFEILSAELMNAEGTAEFKQLRADRWQCTLSILPASVKQGAAVQVHTSCEDQPEIIIPVETVNE
ncbi:MAG: DUF1573 domain-containing protein [Pontiellaceae bacterium]|nr:DUF1573 domain-containing protein [Pontiellaceae bacterium]